MSLLHGASVSRTIKSAEIPFARELVNSKNRVSDALRERSEGNIRVEEIVSITVEPKKSVLFVGDIHIKFDNLGSIDKLETILQQECGVNNDIQCIVVAGDILDTHERIHTQLLNRAYKLLDSFRKISEVIVLVGNHDYINNQQFLTTNHWLNGLKEWDNITIIDKPTIKFNYLFTPYVPTGRFIEALETLNDDWKSVICIFAHQEINQCKLGCIYSIDGDEWDDSWPMLISGHIHERHMVKKNVLYPGSVINHSYSNDNQGVSKYIFFPKYNEKGEYIHPTLFEESKIKLNLDKKTILYCALNPNSKQQQLTNNITQKLTKNTKICLTGNIAEISEFKKTIEYKRLCKSDIKIVFKRADTADFLNKDQETIPFQTILHKLIQKEKDPELEIDFKSVKL